MRSDPPNIHTAALNVAFDTVADRNGESSPRAESRSSGRRSEQNGSPWRGDVGTPRDSMNGQLEPRYANDSRRRRSGRRSGFLLDSTFASPPTSVKSRAKNKGLDGATPPSRQWHETERMSGEASSSSSPMSHRASTRLSSQFDSADSHVSRPSAQSQTIDPAQLVQMALSLSESRKRNVSGAIGAMPQTGPLESPAVATDRTVSAVQHARHQPDLQTKPTNVFGFVEQLEEEDNVVYTFSTATIGRAERARRYFEQASEYRRLLRHLPPVRQNGPRARASTYGSTSTGRHSKLSRSETTKLDQEGHESKFGTPYNPLQSLRNRQVRLREGLVIPDPGTYWPTLDGTKRWVDKAVEAAQDPRFRRFDDHISLPDPSSVRPVDGSHIGGPSTSRGRADTMESGTKHFDSSWTIFPSELLADIYWVEQEDNKRWVEDRHGTRLFSQAGFVRRHGVENGDVSDAESNQGDGHLTKTGPDDQSSSRLRKLAMPLTSSRTKRHRRLLSRASSSSSSTSVDSPVERIGWLAAGVNTGPLERYMQERISKEEGQLRLDAALPDMDASDRWELMRRQEPDWSHQDAASRLGTQGSLNSPQDTHRRSKSANVLLNPVDRYTRPASQPTWVETKFPVDDEAQSLKPSSTVFIDQREVNHEPKTGRSRIGFLGNRGKERNKIAQTDFATGVNGNALPPIVTSSPEQRRSFDSTRSGSIKSRKNFNGLLRYDTGMTASSGKDPKSSVGRFFKGGRIGELVRGDSNFLRDRSKTLSKADDDVSVDIRGLDMDDTESDGSASAVGSVRSRANDEGNASPRQSQDYVRGHRKYHSVNLPDFIPAGRDRRSNVPSSANPSWTTLPKPEREAQQNQTNLDAAVRPRIILPSGDSASGSDLYRYTSHSSDQATVPAASSLRRGAIAFGQRHWSISDQATQPPSKTRIVKRDIARAEALLLASGIKVREILRRANSPRDPPNKILVRAAATANLPVPQVPRRKDDMTAMRILSDVIDARESALQAAISKFQLQTAADLASRIDKLHGKIGEDLTTRVHDMSDSADAFVVELTTLQPQQTKQVDEAVNAMIRQRRRQFRLLRHAGFKLLEWFTLGIMWGIWFFVIVLIMLRRAIVVFFALLRWLFTL